jgi:pSer/pThr/pTyr-binding forkhead associated (FHA) protein
MAPWDTRVVLAMVKSGTQVDPELVAKAGAVFAVAKRPGGPFPDRIGVGRARTADISLRLGSVSKYHAYFTHDEKGRWLIWDARSRNGTRVGERRIEPGDGVELSNGTQLTFGDEAFLFFSDVGFRKLLDSIAISR